MVSTSRCGRDNPGSNPGHGKIFFGVFSKLQLLRPNLEKFVLLRFIYSIHVCAYFYLLCVRAFVCASVFFFLCVMFLIFIFVLVSI